MAEFVVALLRGGKKSRCGPVPLLVDDCAVVVGDCAVALSDNCREAARLIVVCDPWNVITEGPLARLVDP